MLTIKIFYKWLSTQKLTNVPTQGSQCVRVVVGGCVVCGLLSAFFKQCLRWLWGCQLPLHLFSLLSQYTLHSSGHLYKQAHQHSHRHTHTHTHTVTQMDTLPLVLRTPGRACELKRVPSPQVPTRTLLGLLSHGHTWTTQGLSDRTRRISDSRLVVPPPGVHTSGLVGTKGLMQLPPTVSARG